MNFPTEPSADLREAASALRQMYVALVNEGFSVDEAMTIVGKVVAAGMKAGS